MVNKTNDLTGLVGRKIVAVHSVEGKAGLAEEYGWEEGGSESTSFPILELDDGTLLFPSRDEEGNDAGALFGKTRDGGRFIVFANQSMGPPRRIEG